MTTQVGSRRWVVGGDRPGLTLVELLVAIAIVAVLATLLLGVAGRAGQFARVARTQQLVTRLHSLVDERYQRYGSARVELNERRERTATDFDGQAVGDWFPFVQDAMGARQPDANDPNATPIMRALGRLYATREKQRMEMPDRWSDVVLASVDATGGPIDLSEDDPTNPPNPPYTWFARFQADRPPLWYQYARVYNGLWTRTNTETGELNTVADVLRNEAAECLYLTVMYGTGDGEARGLFDEADIGDTDGDGALEFLDAWGNPIGWIRWPVGYESDVQWTFARFADLYDEVLDETGNANAALAAVQETLEEQHDPLDLFRVDGSDTDDGTLTAFDPDTGEGVRGWRLTPLIYSAGGDEELGLFTGLVERPTDVFTETVAEFSDPYVGILQDDPLSFPLSDPLPLGSHLSASLDVREGRELATDNITNHVIDAR